MKAICGLDCASCPAFIAFQTDDNAMREETAKKWTEEFGHDTPLKPEDINCRGCLSQEEPLFMHCHECDVRKCGLEKGVESCKYCEEYGCDKIKKLEETLNLSKEVEK
ncbi:MAG: DUF3795 domain-containing protein [archaeon]|nr:MAG: DUF3795 domain-containing protein [archaeon]